jgi:dihydropteroate synthase
MHANLPAIMGVINMSPNSFYKPSASFKQGLALARDMISQGATILDVGGEATNPFVDIDADAPSINNEIDRIVPLVRAIRAECNDVIISVDTSTPRVMEAAVAAGATMINDQRALLREGALDMAVALNVPVCLMHLPWPMRTPGSSSPAQLLKTITADFEEWIERCLKAGIAPEHLILDPGFGTGNYGKSTQENFYLLNHLEVIIAMGFPVLVAWSRKSMIGDVLGGAPADERLYGSVAAATLALQKGASIIRTHDVKPTIDALKIVEHMRDDTWGNISEQTVSADV